MKFSESIVINSSVDQVFAQWINLEGQSEWSKAVVERRKLTEGPIKAGTRFHAVDQWPGRRVAFDMEITEFVQNKRFGARWFKPMEGSWSSKLSETQAGTRLDFNIEMRLPPLMRLFSPVLKRWAKKQNRAFMETFKRHMENRHDD